MNHGRRRALRQAARPWWAGLARVTLAVLVVGAGLVVGGAGTAYATSSNGYHVLSPIRIVDRRIAVGSAAPLQPGRERVIAVAGMGGVPVDATRAAVRMTTAGNAPAGELRVHACGAFDPHGNVLLLVGRVVDTALALPALHDGAFCVTSTAQTDLMVDVEGYESPGAGMAFAELPRTVVGENVLIAAGTTLTVPIAGTVGVPVGAGALSLDVVASGASAGYLTVFSCDAPRPVLSTLNYPGQDQKWFTPAIAPMGASGSICVFAQSAATVSVFLYGYFADGATATANGPFLFELATQRAPGFVAVTPQRLFDTRTALRVGPSAPHDLDLSAIVPADATDVVMNVTVTEPLAAGFVTVWPCDTDRPTASNLNYVAGQTVPNLVTVALSASNHVCFHTSQPAHLLADLSGWYQPGHGAGLVPMAPKRLLDTRTAGTRVNPAAALALPFAAEVDAGANAVVMNVTVTEPAADGYVTVYPCDEPRPLASNLNFVAHQTVPNLVEVALGASRQICFYASQPTDLIVDMAGSYSTTSDVGYAGRVPTRLFDTRVDRDRAPLEAGDTLHFQAGPGAVAPTLEDTVVAIVVNLTVAEPAAPGYVTAYPCASPRPVASNVNFVAGLAVPNLAIVQVDQDDAVCFFAQQRTHLIADEAGYFTALPFLSGVVVR